MSLLMLFGCACAQRKTIPQRVDSVMRLMTLKLQYVFESGKFNILYIGGNSRDVKEAGFTLE